MIYIYTYIQCFVAESQTYKCQCCCLRHTNTGHMTSNRYGQVTHQTEMLPCRLGRGRGSSAWTERAVSVTKGHKHSSTPVKVHRHPHHHETDISMTPSYRTHPSLNGQCNRKCQLSSVCVQGRQPYREKGLLNDNL